MTEADASQLARTFAALIGTDRIRVPHGDEIHAARVILEPENAGEVAGVVGKCEADGLTLAPIGAARTLAQIRPAPVDVGVSLARMNRIIAYEPADMTVVAESGLTLGALNRATVEHGQRLPADPANPERTTLGSLVAAAKAGPIRLSEGTVRDLLIGIRFAGHGGRVVHGGGRVVKNVAGYDLMKVMTGSFGTLGIITETTFKVRPTPGNYTLAVVAYECAADAFDAARKAEAAAPLAHLEVISPSLSAGLGESGRFLALAGFGGSDAEVAAQRAGVGGTLGDGAKLTEGPEAATAYEYLRDTDFAGAPTIAQIAVPPADLPRCVQGSGAQFRAHAGSGVAQLFITGDPDPAQVRTALTRWREIAHGAHGHLRILRWPAHLRAGVDFFDQPPRAAFELMSRLKSTFDPHRIFNPGCFVGGL
jgi:glycolate oxidase FAD binding subunit